MSQQEFSKFALDYLVFGNPFAELRRNGLGKPLRLETTPAKFFPEALRMAFTGL